MCRTTSRKVRETPFTWGKYVSVTRVRRIWGSRRLAGRRSDQLSSIVPRGFARCPDRSIAVKPHVPQAYPFLTAIADSRFKKGTIFLKTSGILNLESAIPARKHGRKHE